MWERPADFHTNQCKKFCHQAFDGVEKYIQLRVSHLNVHLSELRLAVGAKIFVTEAANDLEVAVHASDHKKLLEKLGRLRQRVEAPVVQTAGHQVIPRALRSRARHEGS